MILAAGHGTRLRPLTDELPKPLVPVGPRPALAHIEDILAAAGAERVIVNTFHGADAFARVTLPLLTTFVRETTLLGTAGGIANARSHFGGGDVLIWNGDILARADARALQEARAAAGVGAALLVAPRARGEGSVGLGVSGDIVRIRAFRRGEEVRGGDYIGIASLSAEFVDSLPGRGCLVGDALIPLLEQGRSVVTCDYEGAWHDIGTPREYLGANLRWLIDNGLENFVGDAADISEGVTLERSIVGARAKVVGRGVLRDVVVWPGARVRAPLERAVVTTRAALSGR